MKSAKSRRIRNVLDRVRLTDVERSAAREHLRQGELTADFIVGAAAAIRRLLHGIERGVRAVTRTHSAN